MSRPPVMNWVLMGAIIAVSILAWRSEDDSGSPVPRKLRPILFLFDRRLSDEQKIKRLHAMGKSREEATRLLDTMKKVAEVSPDDYKRLCDLASTYDYSPTIYEQMVLRGWTLKGLIGHMFLHANFLHLAGNMLFLWLFGNAVCAKVGNLWYPLIFIVVGLAAGAAQLLLSPAAAIGASGAINGVVGMYVIFYPLNEISCLYRFIFRYGTFAVSGVWLILMWLAFDIWGVASKGEGIAYFAHLGGFAGGFVLASMLLLTRLVTSDRGERTLYEVFGMTLSPRDAEPVSAPSAVASPAPPRFAAQRPAFHPSSPPEPVAVAEEPSGPPEPIPFDGDSEPEAAGPADTAAPPEPAPAQPKPFLALRCKCGKTFRVSREHAGKVFTCPDCGRRARIPDTW